MDCPAHFLGLPARVSVPNTVLYELPRFGGSARVLVPAHQSVCVYQPSVQVSGAARWTMHGFLAPHTALTALQVHLMSHDPVVDK